MSSEKDHVNTIEALRKKLNRLISEERATLSIKKPKIQRAPASVRGQKKSEKYFEPRWMSIGPIHHGNPKYELAEGYKLALAAKFVRDGGFSSCEDLYFGSVEPHMAGLEGAFDGGAGNVIIDDNEALKWVLFLDGCAVLQFIHSYAGGDGGELTAEVRMKNDQVAFTQHDIFLLENQIPFQVLRLLMAARPNHTERLKKSVLTFIGANAMAPPKYLTYFDPDLLDREPPHHLLDLLLSVVVGKMERTRSIPNPPVNHALTSVDDYQTRGSSSVITIQTPNDDKHVKDEDGTDQQSFRSVTDLKVAGINLKPSATSSLRDVHFSYIGFVGTLQLPPLIVDDLTGSKFMNLIAYEMCPDNTATEYEVTSYISFLDSLIDYPTDVKELRSSQILHNFLGCDKDVARLFNKIGTDLVPNPKVYQHVIEGIEKHYKKRLVTWMAQVYNDHFSTPWTIVTFLAAVLALGLAIIDTLLNVEDKLKKK